MATSMGNQGKLVVLQALVFPSSNDVDYGHTPAPAHCGNDTANPGPNSVVSNGEKPDQVGVTRTYPS